MVSHDVVQLSGDSTTQATPTGTDPALEEELKKVKGEVAQLKSRLQQVTSERDQVNSDLSALRDAMIQQQEENTSKVCRIWYGVVKGLCAYNVTAFVSPWLVKDMCVFRVAGFKYNYALIVGTVFNYAVYRSHGISLSKQRCIPWWGGRGPSLGLAA